MLGEGRCQVGRRTGDNALDLARSVARLGIARGVSAFERFGYLTRNGKSNYAVPLGRWVVKPAPNGALLDDLDRGDWWTRVRRAAREKHAPASFVRCERVLADATLAALTHSDASRWSAVLVALAELEQQMVYSGAFTVKARLSPIPTLSPGWIRAADDGGPELRLALALAGAGRGRESPDPVRAHWLPLDPRTGRFRTRERGLAKDARVVCGGRDPEGDLIALVERRLVESAGRTLPIAVGPDRAARATDLAALLDGSVDVERTLWLARALSAVDEGAIRIDHLPTGPGRDAELDPPYLALRLAHLAVRLKRGDGEVHIPVDPSPVRLLAAGQTRRAFDIVRRRLRAAGIEVPFLAVTVDPERGRRMTASLAFPISAAAATRFAALLDPDPEESSDAR